jgi:hypothetical protein
VQRPNNSANLKHTAIEWLPNHSSPKTCRPAECCDEINNWLSITLRLPSISCLIFPIDHSASFVALDGIGKPCFFQKHVGPGVPQWHRKQRFNCKQEIRQEGRIPDGEHGRGFTWPCAAWEFSKSIPGAPGTIRSRRPDRIIFDLDPDEAVPWATLASTAQDASSALKTGAS